MFPIQKHPSKDNYKLNQKIIVNHQADKKTDQADQFPEVNDIKTSMPFVADCLPFGMMQFDDQ
jgi:hypothetical protein